MAWVLNWVWQGLVIAVVAAAGLRAFGPRACAATRYRVWGVAFVAVTVLPLVELTVTIPSWPAGRAPTPLPGDEFLRVLVPDLPAWWSIAAWVGVAAFGVAHAVRLVIALRWLVLAKREAAPLPRELAEALAPAAHAVPRRRATLVVCPRVRVAAVLGLARPLIALAPRALGSLTRPELTCIVAHERAHLDRWDDVVGGAQRLVMAVVGWHPALRWADRRLHAERERACDDRAVAATGSARAYAACLVRVAELASAREPVLALGVSSSPADLIQRVERLVPGRRGELEGRARAPRRWDRAAAMTVSLAAAALGLTLRQPFGTASLSTPTASRWSTALTPPLAMPERASSAGVFDVAPLALTAGVGAGRTGSSFVLIDPAAAQSRDAGAVSTPNTARVPPRRLRARVSTPPELGSQARVAAPRLAGRVRPTQTEDALPGDTLTSDARTVSAEGRAPVGVHALTLAALPVPVRNAPPALVTVVDTNVDRRVDIARQRGAAWWTSAARVGRRSANAAKSTAAAFADAGRAVGRTFVGGPRADAASDERRASLETPGAHAFQR